MTVSTGIDRIMYIRNKNKELDNGVGGSVGVTDNNLNGSKNDNLNENKDYIGSNARTVQIEQQFENITQCVGDGIGDEKILMELVTAVMAANDNMDAFSCVLNKIEKAFISINNSGIDNLNQESKLESVQGLRRVVEDIMFSTEGQLLNEHVLTPFGCRLEWEDECESESYLTTTGSTSPPSPGRALKGLSSPWAPKLGGVNSTPRIKRNNQSYRALPLPLPLPSLDSPIPSSTSTSK